MSPLAGTPGQACSTLFCKTGLSTQSDHNHISCQLDLNTDRIETHANSNYCSKVNSSIRFSNSISRATLAATKASQVNEEEPNQISSNYRKKPLCMKLTVPMPTSYTQRSSLMKTTLAPLLEKSVVEENSSNGKLYSTQRKDMTKALSTNDEANFSIVDIDTLEKTPDSAVVVNHENLKKAFSVLQPIHNIKAVSKATEHINPSITTSSPHELSSDKHCALNQSDATDASVALDVTLAATQPMHKPLIYSSQEHLQLQPLLKYHQPMLKQHEQTSYSQPNLSTKSTTVNRPQLTHSLSQGKPSHSVYLKHQMPSVPIPPLPKSGTLYRATPEKASSISAQVQDNQTQPSMAEKQLAGHTLLKEFADRFELISELGSGGFGFVLGALDRHTGKEVAAKFILKSRVASDGWVRDPQLGVIPIEVYFLRHCRHTNIISYVAVYSDHKFVYFVTELHGSQWVASKDQIQSRLTQSSVAQVPVFPVSAEPVLHSPYVTPNNSTLDLKQPIFQRSVTCPFPAKLARRPSMDLFECIEQYDRIPEESAKGIFFQVVQAIRYLHCKGVVHRDIKDENIVIDGSFHVKIIDFGSAAVESSDPNFLFDRFQGTIQYASPEILRGEKYRGKPTDVWALGILLYTILYGEVPFASSEQAKSCAYKPPRFPSSPKCMDLLGWMLQKHASQRPTADQILCHPWFESIPQPLHYSPPSADAKP
ncbi:hypothetical protein BDV3_006150 [Batrachochytrium dendrobatidis]